MPGKDNIPSTIVSKGGRAGTETLGDKLYEFQLMVMFEYKSIIGDMSDLEAAIGLQRLFEESLPMLELQELLATCPKDEV